MALGELGQGKARMWNLPGAPEPQPRVGVGCSIGSMPEMPLLWMAWMPSPLCLLHMPLLPSECVVHVKAVTAPPMAI